MKNCDIRRWYLGSLCHESHFESNLNYFSAVVRISCCTFKTYLFQHTCSLCWQIYGLRLLLVYHQTDVSIGMLLCMRKVGMLLQKHESLAEPWIPNRMMEHICLISQIHPRDSWGPSLFTLYMNQAFGDKSSPWRRCEIRGRFDNQLSKDWLIGTVIKSKPLIQLFNSIQKDSYQKKKKGVNLQRIDVHGAASNARI